MTLVHNRITAALDVLEHGDWNDVHVVDFADYLVSDWTFPSSQTPTDFTTYTSGSATASAGLVSGHNFFNLVTGATASSLATLELDTGNTTNPSDLPVFTSALKLETTDQLEFGFFVFSDTPFTANNAGAFFRVSGGTLYAVTGDGSSETATNLGTPSTYDQYFIEFTSTDVRFYKSTRDNLVATNTTNIPAVDLTIKHAAKTSGTTSQIMRIDGIGIQRLRMQ